MNGADSTAALKAAVRDNGVETVRIVFPDQHGILRGKAVPVRVLDSALGRGVTMTSTLLLKDTSHRTVFPVWDGDAGFGAGVLTGAGDVVMRPDPMTFRILPWAPHSAWLMADIHLADGTPFAFGSREVLRRAMATLAAAGLALRVGLELEFHVYRITDARLGHGDGGMPPAAPETELLTHGGQYLTEDRYAVLEPVMDDLRRAAEKLGLPVRSMEVEFGASQFEFTFDPADPLTQADNMVMFRTMAKQVCRDRGLHATFMARPQLPNGMASGWHLHQSLSPVTEPSTNLFVPAAGRDLTDHAAGWIAGLLAHAAETMLFAVPTVNGYKRFGTPYQLAPDRIAWGHDNKGAMVRALLRAGDPASRLENRAAEPAANPYFHMAAQIMSGLDGIQRGLQPPAPVDRPYADPGVPLPGNLGEALAAFEAASKTGGGFVADAFGPDFAAWYAVIRRAEWNRFLATVTDWEQREYF